MMVLKRKEVVAAALVLLIGVAGYLNWSYHDTIRVTDGDSYIETGKRLGEAKYVSSTAEGEEISADESEMAADGIVGETGGAEPTMAVGEYFSEAKTEKESSRSRALEILQKTAENESFDKETRINAQNQILAIAANTEKEAVIESIAKAKGYENISVYIDGENADIIISKRDFGESDAAKLKEIVAEQLEIPAQSIKIVEMK